MEDTLEETLGITVGRPAATRSLGDRHRITAAAWKALLQHHGKKLLTQTLALELHQLAPIAQVAYQQQRLLVTDFAFGARMGDQTLCYRPNQEGGITISLPGERYA